MKHQIVVVQTASEKKRSSPTFWGFFLVVIRIFLQLPARQKVHVGAASLTLVLCAGLISMATIDTAVEHVDKLPAHKASITTPANITLSIPEPEPTIFPEEVSVPDNSVYVPEQPLTPKSKSNPAFPVGVKELIPKSSEEYIKRYSKVAVAEMKQFGVPASISLAQGLIESRAGTSKLAVSNKNHFGMKCFSKNCRKGHCTNHKDDTHKDFFKKFSSDWESWRAHSQLLTSGRYAKLKKHGRDYRAWAYGLKSAGYATDRTYAEKLIGIIERYDLHKYDR